MLALCEQFTHRSADSIGVFPAVACTTHWVPEVLYSRAAKPCSQRRQTANRLTLQHCHQYIGLSCNSSICIEQIDLCLPTVEGDFVVMERSLSQRF